MPDTFVLFLNDMRSPKIEHLTPFVRGYDPDEIAAFVEQELVEPYKDERWGKTFRKGGPLEWANPPEWLGGTYGHITNVSEQAREFLAQFGDLPLAAHPTPSSAEAEGAP